MSEDRQLRALEAVRHVEVEYGLRTASLKPCIAFLLDGNIGGATRHEAAFVIAIDCRRMGLTEHETEAILTRWATKIGYGTGKACSAIRNAYAKKNNSYQYFPPGITKRPGTGYERVSLRPARTLAVRRTALPTSRSTMVLAVKATSGSRGSAGPICSDGNVTWQRPTFTTPSASLKRSTASSRAHPSTRPTSSWRNSPTATTPTSATTFSFFTNSGSSAALNAEAAAAHTPAIVSLLASLVPSRSLRYRLPLQTPQ